MRPRLLGISGSLRRESYSTAVLRTVMGALADEIEGSTFDIGALPLYNADLDGEHPPESVRALKAAIAGVLKNAIDGASRPGYQSVLQDKPAAIISTSGGVIGGARAQQQLKTTLLGTLTRVLPWPDVLVTNAGTKVKDGRFIDEAGLALSLDLVRALLREVR